MKEFKDEILQLPTGRVKELCPGDLIYSPNKFSVRLMGSKEQYEYLRTVWPETTKPTRREQALAAWANPRINTKINTKIKPWYSRIATKLYNYFLNITFN